MDEKPKSIWKKSYTLPQLLLTWLGLMVAIGLVCMMSLFVSHNSGSKMYEPSGLLIFSSACATLALGAWLLIRRVFCRRNLKRSLFGLACLATLVALFYAEEDWRGKRDWENFKSEWTARGERFDRASIIPPVVPDDQNFAMTPVCIGLVKSVIGSPARFHGWYGNRIDQIEPVNITTTRTNSLYFEKDLPDTGDWSESTMTQLAPWQAYYRAPGKNNATNEFPIAPQPQSPAADVLLALSKYDTAIEQIRQAVQLPYSRFPLEYDAELPPSILLPHLAALKRCSQVLQLRAIAELQNGESQQAADDVKLSLRVADAIHSEPILISHLVRISILRLTLQPIYEGLARHQWQDAQLAEMADELARLDFLADYKSSMRGAMIGLQIGTFDYLRRHPGELYNISSDEGEDIPGIPPPFLCSLIPQGWFYQNQVRCARLMEEQLLPAANLSEGTVLPEKIEKANALLKADLKSKTPYSFMEGVFLSSLGKAADRFAHGQTDVNLARVAIALERYRLAHGEFPATLDALAPQFLDPVPHDVIGGQPLHYRLASNGQFVLYSVGWNGIDDGGVLAKDKQSDSQWPLQADTEQGDWVWKYPGK